MLTANESCDDAQSRGFGTCAKYWLVKRNIIRGRTAESANDSETVEQAVNDALLAHGRPVELRWLIDTNGTLLTDSVLEWLAPPRPAKVFVSLDGVPAAHDINRVSANGQGTHAVVVEGIRRLRARQIPFGIVAVVGPDTGNHLGESLALL